MSFIESPRFPTCVALGALSKPRYKTSVIPTLSGYASRNIEWAQPLHSFDFGKVLDQTAHDSLLAFFHAAQGRGHQFRVRDPGDYSTTTATGVLLGLAANSQVVAAAGVGTGHRSTLAGKRYVAGNTTYRYLQKLVAGTVKVYRAGVQVTEGIGAGQISVDTTTGKISWVANQSEPIVTHVVGNPHRITVNAAFSPNVAIGGRVFISGVTGADAAMLNLQSFAVVNVSAAVIDIDVNTTGLTLGGGTAALYVQPTETLTIECEFDVPCVFSSDEASFDLFQKTAQGSFYYQWQGINLEEDRLALPAP